MRQLTKNQPVANSKNRQIISELQSFCQGRIPLAPEPTFGKGFAEGEAKGRTEGRAEGLAEGEAKGRTEVARAMLKENIPFETICRITGFTPQQMELISKTL